MDRDDNETHLKSLSSFTHPHQCCWLKLKRDRKKKQKSDSCYDEFIW